MDAVPTTLPKIQTMEVASLVAQARGQLASLERELAQLDQLEREMLLLQSTLRPWDPLDQKQPMWDLARELPDHRRQAELRTENIVSLLGQALELDPHTATARSMLADLYWMLFSRAEERDEADHKHYLALLGLHDDGRYADLVEGTGTLQLQTEPCGARVRLHVDSAPGAPAPRAPCDLGRTPVDPTDVAPGRYQLEITLAGHAPTHRPIEVHRGADLQLRVRLFPSREVGPDFQYVPAGRFKMGGDHEAPCSGPARAVFVDNFAVARLPVTIGEYMLFIDDLCDRDPGLALRHSPLPATGGASRDPRLPVSGISLEAAEAYCAWLSARTGLPHRLPAEAEWEKAARGVDGRIHPWGDRFDPSLCHTRRSRPGQPCKEAVGSFASDVSVYGVRDLAGGVAEWTQSPFNEQGDELLQVARGGSFEDGAERCRCAARIPLTPAAHSDVGFRLVRPLAPGGGDRVSPAPVPAMPLEHDDSPPYSPWPMLPVKQALDQVLAMSRRLAASGAPAELLPQLLSETVSLVHAERGMLLQATDADGVLTVLEARGARGEPIPASDQGFEAQIPCAALKQGLGILLGDDHPVLAVPLPDGETCLLLERRFHRTARFSDECLLVAAAAGDPLALALRLTRAG